MNHLAIDIETFSSAPLKKVGVYNYVNAPDFEILLFGYSLNDGPAKVIDLTDGRGLPQDLRDALHKPNYRKSAWHAMFERACLGKIFGPMDPDEWECTMVKATMLGLPASLDQAGHVVDLKVQKDKEGAALLRYFTMPCRPTAANGYRTRNLPEHDPEKWMKFISYCETDVNVERAMDKRIDFFCMPDFEQDTWELDQQINDRGILMDHDMILKTIHIDTAHRQKLTAECIELTGLHNPNSVKQLLGWLQEEMPEETVTKLRKQDIPVLKELAADYVNEDDITRVLEIRQELSKTSIKKYQAMLNVRGEDGRARGLFQYYGANRTGRWAGRLIQMHNLPKTTMIGLDRARKLIQTGNTDLFEILDFEDEDHRPLSVPEVLSQLIRTAFIPKPGYSFVVVDSSAIEARIIAWLSGEEWRMEIFRTHGKIYEASAARMFKKPIEEVTTDDRGRGKVAELALGYQGSVDAMMRMDLKKKVRKLAEEKYKMISDNYWESLPDGKPELEDFIYSEHQEIVDRWRSENQKIKALWFELNAAAIDVVKNKTRRRVSYVSMFVERGVFFIELPSGRRLSYLRPTIRTKIVTKSNGDQFEVEGVAYMGVDQENKKWIMEHTYGGKLAENICQAIARDCLAYWMRALRHEFTIVGHVHDETILEVVTGFAEMGLDHAIKCMSKEIPWAPGLPLAAAGFVTDYYKKD